MNNKNFPKRDLDLTNKALSAIKVLREKVENLQQRDREPLAIVGMACRFPGGVDTPEDFWQLLIQKKDAIVDIPGDRWDVPGFYHPDPAEPGKMYANQGGFIDRVYEFDAELFGLSKRESESMDPQQRLLLELTWQALERSGIAPRQSDCRHRTGLFVGMATNDYSRFHINSNNADAIDVYSFTGSAPSIASGRIAQLMDFGGPTLTIDTACSSAIVALHLAKQSILSGECDVALAAGVNLMLSPENTIYFCKTSALSPDNRCKTFDDSANGYVRSEGAGVVVLKRLSQAIKDKNPILALLQGSAINHDGRGSALTAPNGESQQRLIRAALANARINSEDIGFIETHGTGTPLGDPIELQSLGEVFQTCRHPIPIGACKSNIGHLEAAAGVAGIIKTILCLQHKTLVANLHFDKPSSYIPWQRLPFRVLQDSEHWQAINGKRIAGVSAFGFSGSNSHAILTEAPMEDLAETEERQENQLLVLSGLSESRLQKTIADMRDYVVKQDKIDLPALCFTENSGRFHFKHRIAIRFDSRPELLATLQAVSQGNIPSHVKSGQAKDLPSKAVVLKGFDSTHHNARDYLYSHKSAFRRAFDECADLFKTGHGIDILQAATDPRQTHEFLLDYANYPMQFGFYYAWLSLLKSWLNPVDYYVAEGPGLLASACCAGYLSLQEAVSVCSAFIQGKSTSLAEKQSHVKHVPIACTVNGESEKTLRSFDFWYSTFTKATSIEERLTKVAPTGPVVTINCSPDDYHLRNNFSCVSAFDRQRDILHSLNEMVATLYCQGVDINWDNYYQECSPQKIILPTTPFERREYRLPSSKLRHQNQANKIIDEHEHPLLGHRIASPLLKEICFQQYLSPGQVPFLLDHGFLHKVVVPATAYLEMIASALQRLHPGQAVNLADVNYYAALYLPEDNPIYIQLIISGDEEKRAEIFSAVASGERESGEVQWIRHCSAIIEVPEVAAERPAVRNAARLLTEIEKGACLDNFYPGLNQYGYLFGPAHQGVTRIVKLDESSSLAIVECAENIQLELKNYYFHPAHLDSCCHAILALLPQDDPDHIYITVGKDKIHFFGQAEATVFAKADIVERTTSSIKANLTILNQAGDCLALVEGYTMKRVPRAQLSETRKPLVSQGRYDEWLYQPRWQSCDLPKAETASLQDSDWLLYYTPCSDNVHCAEQITATLKTAGARVSVASPHDDLKSVLENLTNPNSQGACGIIHIDVEYQRPAAANSVTLLNAATQSGVLSLSNIIRNLPLPNMPLHLVSITKGVQQVTGSEGLLNFSRSSVWGLGRSIFLEHPNIKFINLDLCNALPFTEADRLLDIIGRPYDEDQFAIRSGKIYIRRLARLNDNLETVSADAEKLSIPEDDNYKLSIDEQGSIENLYYKSESRSDLDDDEVEIEVSTAALNFYDVVTALNLIDTSIVNGKENDECRFGLDAVGRVSRVGKHVRDYHPGQWVMGFAPGSFSHYVKVHQDCVTSKPTHLGIYESATIPTVFLTAYYALHNLAGLKKGDRVLIHAAAGGVGIAAINLANVAGAEIYATASKPKWPLLKSLGVKHIYDSRTLDFAEQIKKDTDGEGVDIVLNSFIGDYITKNVEVLKPNGQFIEIGEREILGESDLRNFDKPFNYQAFTLFDISRHSHADIKAMFGRLQKIWQSESFIAIPYQVFEAEDIKQAFRLMQQGRHKGKVLVTFDKHLSKSRSEKPFYSSTNAVLITGGSGGIGLATGQWLSKKGIGAIYLMGRRAVDAHLLAAIEQMRSSGCVVEYVRGDVGDRQDLVNALNLISRSGIALKGIIHAAGIMKNGLIANQSPRDAQEVLAAKTLGALQLHELTLDKDLEFFVCFSSMTSILGAVGAGSYAAGNAFLDGLMGYRKQLGLPALSINWAAWDDVGMLTRLNPAAKRYWRESGIQALSSSAACEVMDLILTASQNQRQSQIAVLPANWSIWNRQYSRIPSLLKDISLESADSKKAASQTAEIHFDQTEINPEMEKPVIVNTSGLLDIQRFISDNIKKVLRLDKNVDINYNESFQNLGIDSLMSVELVNMISKKLNIKLSKTIIFDYSNINALANHLLNNFTDSTAFVEPEKNPEGNTMSIDEIKQIVTKNIKSALHLKPSDAVNENELFSELGIDSLVSVELKNLLCRSLKIELSSTTLFNYPTIKLLTEFLNEKVKSSSIRENKLNGELHTSNEPVNSALNMENTNGPSLEDIRAFLDERFLTHKITPEKL